jgi:hypothetical protein
MLDSMMPQNRFTGCYFIVNSVSSPIGTALKNDQPAWPAAKTTSSASKKQKKLSTNFRHYHS